MRATGLLLVSVFAFAGNGCSKSARPPDQYVQLPVSPTTNATPAAGGTSEPSAPPSPSASAQKTASERAVKTEMRNVLFHLTAKSGAHIETMAGMLVPTGKNEMPSFDDKTSFDVRIQDGRISITPEALADILNSYALARKDSPLKGISIQIKDNQVVIKGRLASKGNIPFQTAGTVSVTPDGRLRVHTEKVKAFKIPVKGILSLFGIELANVVNTSKIAGMDTDKNDLLMDLSMLLPPPHILGKVTAVELKNNTIVTVFGNPEKLVAAPSAQKSNFMSFHGNSVRFGNLTMSSTDLTVLDLDPHDPLDWSQDRYKDQLVAGYSKITANFGLRAYVRDYAKLPNTSAGSSATSPAPARAESTSSQVTPKN